MSDLHTEANRPPGKLPETLPRTLIRSARRHPFRFAMADLRTPGLRFGSALTRAVFLARRLKPLWQGQRMVGILLPPSVPGALVNWAALLSGKIPVNLNYTASEPVLASCAQQCGLQTVVTARAFLDRVKIQAPGKAIFLEELAERPRLGEKLKALWMAWALPAAALERRLSEGNQTSLDDLATVIFSSGSTGDPKGVMLTHSNIASNIEQVNCVFAFTGQDRILGILPFFHSFGFTATLALPAVLGVGAVYHPNPLDAAAIGSLVRRHRATFLLATPTFLQTYLRRCSPEDFASLRFVVVGAEKLPEHLAVSFEDTFGIQPMEGYGCTECAPVVAANAGSPRGNKRGTVGRPLPGVSVRIVDPETRQPLPVGQPGLLLVRGPNVMKGYLGQSDKTAEVLRDGWYTTGDVAALDKDGFLTLTDRLSRFSKMGGEMVPHLHVEERLHQLIAATEQVLVVTGVPDGKKGERLVVLHTLPQDKLQECLQRLPEADLPNLWKPRPNQFFPIEAIPLLGTGKLDLRRVRALAQQLSADP